MYFISTHTVTHINAGEMVFLTIQRRKHEQQSQNSEEKSSISEIKLGIKFVPMPLMFLFLCIAVILFHASMFYDQTPIGDSVCI